MSISALRSHKGFHEINVTPLVDVMLVLLMVFMVTAPLLSNGVEVKLPKVSAAATTMRDPELVLTVTEQGRVLLDRRDISDDIEGALADDARVRREGALYLQADRAARYADVVRALAAA
ncbi:MAG: ExbD/TolR family protein [Polyangiales bacterium]